MQKNTPTDWCGSAVCSRLAASLAEVSAAQPKVNPPGNLFYRGPITTQTQGVASSKPIIIWHESECNHTTTSTISSMSPDSLHVYSGTSLIYLQCVKSFNLHFNKKTNKTPLLVFLFVYCTLFYRYSINRGHDWERFPCLVFSCNSPGWTPCCENNLHFDGCTLEVYGTTFLKADTQEKNTERTLEREFLRIFSLTVEWNGKITWWDLSHFTRASADARLWFESDHLQCCDCAGQHGNTSDI